MFHKSWKMFGLFYVYRFVVILLQQVTYTCLSGSIIWFRIKSVLQFYLVLFILTFFIRVLKFYFTILHVHFLLSNIHVLCYRIVRQKSKQIKKTSWYLALYKIWQSRECMVSPWWYIAIMKTNVWIKSKIFSGILG